MTNDSGSAIARYAFDPWGKRLVLAGSADATHHGFTGHEHLDEVGLVHMNGRVYDPVLGRFMSADPYIQAPDNLQSYNRYSYVWNNPLSATDPSGYFKWSKFFKSMVTAHFAPTPQNLFNAIHNQPGQKYIDGALLRYPLLASAAQIAAGFYGGPWGAAAFSAYMTGLQGGGNFEMAKAFAITYGTATAFKMVGTEFPGPIENVVAHAAVGCLSSAAGGGSCQAGAVSAGLGAAMGGSLIASAIAGGVGAELGGGKFANGAVMGAFGYLFNKALHSGFGSQSAAARAALTRANPLSIDENLEYGGLIYKDRAGRYNFTGPIQGSDQGVNPFDAPIPLGTRLVGDYHTHGDYSVADSSGRAVRTSDPARDDFNSDHFSASDKQGITELGTDHRRYRGYLGTPSGKFKVFNPTNGREKIFR